MPGFVIFGSIILLIALLALCPVRVSARLHLAPDGGILHLKIRYLIASFGFRLRIDALGPPALTLSKLTRGGGVRKLEKKKKRKKKWKETRLVRMLLRVGTVKGFWINLLIGIEGAAAETALIASALSGAFGEAKRWIGSGEGDLPLPIVTVMPDFQRTIFQMSAECMISASPAKLIQGFILMKKGGKARAASD